MLLVGQNGDHPLLFHAPCGLRIWSSRSDWGNRADQGAAPKAGLRPGKPPRLYRAVFDEPRQATRGNRWWSPTARRLLGGGVNQTAGFSSEDAVIRQLVPAYSESAALNLIDARTDPAEAPDCSAACWRA